MKQFVIVILISVLCLLFICNEETSAAVLPDDSGDSLGGYSADDLNAAIRAVLVGETEKRGFRCRPGYTYQSILRDCVPSLGALRGRGRRPG